MMPLARISRAVSSSSWVNRLVFALVFLVFVAMLHLDQNSVLQGLCDLLVIRGKPGRDDLTQSLQLTVVNIFPLIFSGPEQKDGEVCPESDQHSKATSF